VHDVAVKPSDGAALEGVYRDQAPNLWRALLAYSGDRDVASDAVNEAFAQALRRGEGIQDPVRWVWKVAFRLAAADLKERRRDRETVDEVASEIPQEALEMLLLLRRLPPKQRAAIVLHYYVTNRQNARWGYPRVSKTSPVPFLEDRTRGVAPSDHLS
jgi:DNA-directed RNA polymerase specialized sigma24 family protein